MSYVLKTTSGELACSWCGNVIAGNTWQAQAARGFFCGKNCRDVAASDKSYCTTYPRKVVA